MVVDMVDRNCVVSGYLVMLGFICEMSSGQSCLCSWANDVLTCVRDGARKNKLL